MVYLITGGTGSFGQAYTRWLLDNTDYTIRILSRDEQKQDEMRKKFDSSRLRFLLGDVRDIDRLNLACRGVDIVIHAAALKIVPMCEYTPAETVKTNIIGTMNVIEACVVNNVKRCIGIGTDKAVRPVNLYGATKLCAERLMIHSNSYASTEFNCVRYGNVIGSRGSAGPAFAAQEVIDITDPNMTRFWLTMNMAVDLVNTSIASEQIGCVFIAKAPSASVMVFKDALAPGKPYRVVGIRAGEKIHETLISSEESLRTTENQDIYIIGKTAVRESPFEYRSDTNTWKVDPEELRELMGANRAKGSGKTTSMVEYPKQTW